MYDRFYVLLSDGSCAYTFDFRILCTNAVTDILSHERTFDNGKTWVKLD